MGSILKHGTDDLRNGVVLGGLLGATIYWGETIKGWILSVIPQTWTTFAGDFSVPIILIGTGCLLGWIIDRH